MSDKTKEKRGLLGRLFGGKAAPDDVEPALPPTDSEQLQQPGSDEAGRSVEEREADASTSTQMPNDGDATTRETTQDGLEQEQFPQDVESSAGPDATATTSSTISASQPSSPLTIDRSETDAEPQEPKKTGWFQKLKVGLTKTSSRLSDGISGLFTKQKLDADTLEDFEDLLIQADLGVETAMRITEQLSKGRFAQGASAEDVRQILADEVARVLEPVATPLAINPDKKPHVILMVGVNGTGKTTTIGKLASNFASQGKKVMLAAGDTFRAAAIEQLQVWGERTGATVMTRPVGSDASGLAFDALTRACEDDYDILLIDTAGRLQNKKELMDELEKVARVLSKVDESAPHDVLLVLDATTGQNALQQVEVFRERAGVSGLVMTKLDGTARGGIIVAISAKHRLPVHAIGVGEGIDDLQPFDAQEFARAIALS